MENTLSEWDAQDSWDYLTNFRWIDGWAIEYSYEWENTIELQTFSWKEVVVGADEEGG